MNKYIVYYKLGSIYDKINVEAHTKEQAGRIAGMQARYTYKSRGRCTIILTLEEGEPMPYRDLDEKYLVKKA